MKSNKKDISRVEIDQLQEDNVTIIRRSIIKIYADVNGELKLIWEAIRSCFGSGFWINNRPWINNSAWKNK